MANPFVVWARTDGTALMYALLPEGYAADGTHPSPSASPLQWTLVEEHGGGVSTMPRLQGPSGDEWFQMGDVGL